MNILAVSAAKWGIQNAVYSLLDASSQTDAEYTHLTLPIHSTPDSVTRIEFLSENYLRRLERVQPLYLFYAIYFFWALVYRYIKRNRDTYDLIWLHSPRLLLLCPHSFDSKIVATIHGPLMHTRAEKHGIPARYYYRLLGKLQRYGIRKRTRVTYTVVNDEIVDDLRGLGVPDDQIHVIGNGVDVDKFTPEKAAADINKGCPATDVTLLSVGRLTELKRPLALIELYHEIAQVINNQLYLILVGDGPLRSEVEQLVRERKLENQVTFVGTVEYEKIPTIYASADIFILLSEYEGEPLVLYEAMASGLPSIVADIPSCRFIEKEDSGIVIDLDQWDQSVERVLEYLNTDHERHGKNARSYANETLRWSMRLREYHEVFIKKVNSKS